MKKAVRLLVGILIAGLIVPREIKAEELKPPEKPKIRTEAKWVEGQVVVKYKDKKELRVIDVLEDQMGRQTMGLESKRQKVVELVEKYKSDPTIEYAEPNYIYQAFYYPNDPYMLPANNGLGGFQWNLSRIRMPEAWNLTPSASGVKVAVLDAGVAYENYTGDKQYTRAPELANTVFVAPYKYISASYYLDSNGGCEGSYLSAPIISTHANDDNGHGTHITSTITQATNNGQHASGIAPGVQIMPIKIMDANGCTNSVDLAAGIDHAVANGAKVLNLSLGMDQTSTTVTEAINRAFNAGVSVVAATGNSASRSYSPPISYPAAQGGVIAVGATRYDNIRAEYSQYGSGLTLVAPGGQMGTDDYSAPLDQNGDHLADGIVAQTIKAYPITEFTSVSEPNSIYANWRCVIGGSFYLEDNCGTYQGTSMAAPHVTAVVALMLSRNSGLTPAQIKTILTQTAQKSVIPGYNQNEHGAGLLDAYAALNAAANTNPTATPTPKPGDFNADKNKDFQDLRLLWKNFGKTDCTYNLVGSACLINIFDVSKWMKL